MRDFQTDQYANALKGGKACRVVLKFRSLIRADTR
jgi:hypothetical protein